MGDKTVTYVDEIVDDATGETFEVEASSQADLDEQSELMLTQDPENT